MSQAISTKKCLICKGGRKNDCLHWHKDPETNDLWVWCQGKCQRGYSIFEYTARAGISLNEFLKQDFDIREAPPNEVQQMEWPASFVPLYDHRAKAGLEYLKTRGIAPDDNMYYDTWRKGIVFPYFYDNIFCGAQVRLVEPWVDEDGEERKIDTIPGTRLGLLFYNWNQQRFNFNIKGIIITEGAFNALAIQQALHHVYGGLMNCPWLCVALSGSGASKHHIETLKDLKDKGYKVVVAPDSDDAGVHMLRKFIKNDALTHFALTNDYRIDWNDVGQTMNKTEFVKWFLGSIRDVRSQKESYGADKEASTEE